MVTRFLSLVTILIIAVSAWAQTSYDRFLLPVAAKRGAPGAFNSSWVALTWIKNASSLTLDFNVPRPCVFECPPQRLQPQETREIELSEPAADPGFIMYIERPTDNVWFFSRVYDQSQQSLTYGTEIPVVRENQFYDRPFVLPGVPADPRFRVLLRIYDMSGRTDGVATVRELDWGGVQEWGSVDVTLQRGVGSGTPPQNKPSYAAIALPGAFSTVLDAVGKPRRPEFDLEITPKSPGLKLWAFVTVTNNETQHVTTITPH